MTDANDAFEEFIESKAIRTLLRRHGIPDMATLCTEGIALPSGIVENQNHKVAVDNAKKRWLEKTTSPSTEEIATSGRIVAAQDTGQPRSPKNESPDRLERAGKRAVQIKSIFEATTLFSNFVAFVIGSITTVGSCFFLIPWPVALCTDGAGIGPIVNTLNDPKNKKACAENALVKAFLHEPLDSTADEVVTIFFALHEAEKSWLTKTQLIHLGKVKRAEVRVSPRSTISTPASNFLSHAYLLRSKGAIEKLSPDASSGWETYSSSNAEQGDWIAIVAGYDGDVVPSQANGSSDWCHVEMSDYAVGVPTNYRFAIGTSDREVRMTSWDLVPCARGPAVIGREQPDSTSWKCLSIPAVNARDRIWGHLADELKSEWRIPELKRPDGRLENGNPEEQNQYRSEKFEYEKTLNDWSDRITGWQKTFRYLIGKDSLDAKLDEIDKRERVPAGKWILDSNEKQQHDVAYTVRWK